MKKRLTNQDWADLARSCGLRLEYDGACHAMPLIFAIVKLQPIYGMEINLPELDSDHLLMLLYFGADVLESKR